MASDLVIDNVDDCLTDIYVDKYMDLITKLSPSTVYAFNTQFYTVLSEKGFSRVHRWTKKVDIFSKQRLFIPIHNKQENHWSLINVNFKYKSIRYYDSLGRNNIKSQNLILKYLKLEYFMKKGKFFPAEGWSGSYLKLHTLATNFNTWDCGLFICVSAEYLSQYPSKNGKMIFSPKDEKKFKKKVLLNIQKNSITQIVPKHTCNEFVGHDMV